jgi:hypothetical protein
MSYIEKASEYFCYMIAKRRQQTLISASLLSHLVGLSGTSASPLGSGLNGIINKTGARISILLFESLTDLASTGDNAFMYSTTL